MNWENLKEEYELLGEECFEWMEKEFSKISSGRVNLTLFSNVKVNAYGETVPLIQVANIQTVDARQVLIKPYDKNQIKEIYKALNAINIGATLQINVDNIRALFAPITEETRKQNVKKAKEIFEQGKIKIRNIRQEIQSKIKKSDELTEDDLRYYEEELNKTTKELNNKLELILNKKEKELMTF